MTQRKTPTYNLKAVVRETGLKPDTLRAWERRYGVPTPHRTTGGHRVYSQEDINTLKWLVARQAEGMSISRAVELWQQLRTAGQETDHAPKPSRVFAPEYTTFQNGTLSSMRNTWITACIDFDEQSAEAILNQAFGLYPPEVVCIDLLQRGVAEIGQRWYQGTVTVQQEHFASELALRRLEALMATTPVPTRQHRILVACPPEEDHTFSPLLLSLILRRRGFDVTYLGANVPVQRFGATLEQIQPRLIILSAQQLYTAATLLDMTQYINEHRIPVAYGGRIFNLLPGLRRRIPAYFLGESIDQVPQVVERLVSDNPPPQPAGHLPPGYAMALIHFRANQIRVDATVWQLLTQTNIDLADMDLNHANLNMARNINAGLSLGDLSFLGSDIAWIAGLLTNYSMSVMPLKLYLELYLQALRMNLDERGTPIINWLAGLIETLDLSGYIIR